MMYDDIFVPSRLRVSLCSVYFVESTVDKGKS